MTPGAFPIMTPGVSPQQAAGLYSATGIDLATEMTEFVMASPEALEFVKEGYPQHPLFGKYPTTKTLGTLQKQLEKGPKSVSGLAKTVSGVTSVGLAGLPVYLSAFTVYQITNNTGSAAIGAFLGTVGAIAGVVSNGPAALAVFIVSGVAVLAGLTGGGVGSVVVGVGGFASVAGGVGAATLYSPFSRFVGRIFHRIVSLFSPDVTALFQQAGGMEVFFNRHPALFARFLRESVSKKFRAKEGEAKSRIDGFEADLERMPKEAGRKIEAIQSSKIPDKEEQIERVRSLEQEALDHLRRAIEQERAFMAKLDGFVKEVSQEAKKWEIRGENKGVYEEVDDFEGDVDKIKGETQAAETKREIAGFELSLFLRRLAEMGEEIAFWLQLSEEIGRLNRADRDRDRELFGQLALGPAPSEEATGDSQKAKLHTGNGI